MRAEFLLANEREFDDLTNREDLIALMLGNETSVGLDGFQALFSLPRLFFRDENHVPPEIVKVLTDGSKIYRLGDDFVKKIASFEREEMTNLAALWREDEYWKNKNYEGMGIWSHLYEIYDLCESSLKRTKNLYIHIDEV